MKKDVILAWSGGKESAYCLYKIANSRSYNVRAILTTVTEEYDRISMHGVRRELLEIQSVRLNIPLEIVYIPKNSSNAIYESSMERALLKYKREGIDDVVFGDIFLEDVRRNRVENLAKLEMHAIFPLWQYDTLKTANEFIEKAFKAVITCIDLKSLDKGFLGRIYDRDFLKDLPDGIDPCGENGEFHSFVFDGPLFRRGIEYIKGPRYTAHDRFYYCDLLSRA